MRRSFVVTLTLVLGLSGCTMVPKYKRPDAPVPSQWPSGAAYPVAVIPPEGSPEVPQLKWQEFFTDPKLKKVIETALQNNRDLRLATLNMERVRALYDIQRSELLPKVYADAGGGEQQVSADFVAPGVKRTSKTYDVNLGIVAWEIDFFGRIRSLSQKALEEYLGTEAARRSAQIALVSSVASTYLSLAADRENLALSEETLQSQTSACKLIERQYDLGVVSKLDFQRAQIPVEVARRDVALYRQLVAQSQNALDLLAGSSVPEDLLPVDLASIQPTTDIFPGLSSEVLLRRPDIMVAEHQLKGAYANIGAARAAFFPQISLTTTLGSASNDLSHLFKTGTATWLYGAQATMPIFDARTWFAYRVSKADREIAVTQYEKAIQTAFREVADALAVYGTVGQQVAAQQSLVDTAAETYRLSNFRYEKGIDDYLGVLDAQRSLFAAQQVLVSLRRAKLANQVRLYVVLGGGGEDVAEARTSLTKRILRFLHI
ncbi:MAG TPA: efflux transporter outer membrane subunit [Candidatus Omnitrophota bacterium]|nr:efflux transporter outer membrane subunit [Candidatus Omnitrophota bacterium]